MSFGEILYLSNLDLSILQNAVTIATANNELQPYILEAVAHIT